MNNAGNSGSEQIEGLGVTSVPTLEACCLHLALRRSRKGGGAGGSSPQATLGDVCHAALEHLVQSGAARGNGWERALQAAWQRALRGAGGEAEVAVLPGYQIAKARLRNAAATLVNLLSGVEDPFEFVCEQPMEALGGRLFGRPDLVVRASEAHWVVDYKTGSVLDWGTDAPKESYVGQLELYAVLEREESGAWPERGFLIPFAERIVAVDLDPARCEAAAARYLEAFAAYNSTVPGAQPASPSAEACRWCEFIMRCDATWAAADQDWAPQLRSAAGTVVECAVTALGTATIVIDVAGGTLPVGRMAVTGVRSDQHPAVKQIEAGSVVRLAGLRRGRGKATFSLPPWGHLAAG